MAQKPMAKIEKVLVNLGTLFELDWQDQIILTEYDKGVGDYRLHILRREGQ